MSKVYENLDTQWAISKVKKEKNTEILQLGELKKIFFFTSSQTGRWDGSSSSTVP